MFFIKQIVKTIVVSIAAMAIIGCGTMGGMAVKPMITPPALEELTPEYFQNLSEGQIMDVVADPVGDFLIWIDEDVDGMCDYAIMIDVEYDGKGNPTTAMPMMVVSCVEADRAKAILEEFEKSNGMTI